MSDLYFDYLREMGRFSVVNLGWGFFTYEKSGEYFDVKDFYIEKESRNSSKTKEIIDLIELKAIENSCSVIRGFINLSLKRATQRIVAYSKYGFEATQSHNNRVVVTKEIEHE